MVSKKKTKTTFPGAVPQRPNFHPYLKSIADEMEAVQNRVRLLISHWPTDGRFKETILRNMLRKHLPESVLVGTGFVVSSQKASGEIDILVVDRGMPTLFKEDDLLIVTPESVRAIIEVKTRISSPQEIRVVVDELAERKQVAASHVSNQNIWAGLFVYDSGGKDRHKVLLDALYETANGNANTIDCVAFGTSTLVKFFRHGLSQNGVWPENAWHSFHVPSVAPAMFISSLIAHLMPNHKDHGSFAWDMFPEGGLRRKIHIRKLGESVHDYQSWIAKHPWPLPLGLDALPTIVNKGSEGRDI